MFSLDELEKAEKLVRGMMPPTPQYCWPLLCERTGCELWVKHENHTPIGAFKVRGGLVFLHELMNSGDRVAGLVTATRGNHGQSVALAGAKYGVPVTIYAPHGNSVEKNAAMRAFGAELVEFGSDFDEARVESGRAADANGLTFVPSYHHWLVRGVATYALELFSAVDDLDTVYVPIGMGSGISGLIMARDLLGVSTKVVGVVAKNAPAYALSFDAGEVRETNSAATFADGVACRVPDATALDLIRRGADRIISVGEEEISAAIRYYYTDTHNVVEGAAATPLAALMKEKDTLAGRKVAVILTGGNIDKEPFAHILAGGTPAAS